MKLVLKAACAVLAFSVFLPLSSYASGPQPQTVPEIDPSLAMGAIALLAGTVAVVRGKRNRS